MPDSSTVLGRFGIYAVSIFFVISGISLGIAYTRIEISLKDLRSFWIRRVCRIAPAYWLVTLIIIFQAWRSAHGHFSPDWPTYLGNLSLTFGFYAPDIYLPTGGWSIGDEMVFYLFFPFVFAAIGNKKILFLSTAIATGIYLYYAFGILVPNKPLADQWKAYIHPANQGLLFFAGMLMAKFRVHHTKPFKKDWHSLLLLTCIVGFCFYPADGDQIEIVYGIKRLVFSVFCFGISYAVLNINFNFSALFQKVLKFFGNVSYPLYLIHGVTGNIFMKLGRKALHTTDPHTILIFMLCVGFPGTLLISYAVYRFVEKPIMQYGKDVTSNVS